jgi:hypothetical protein
MEIKRYVQIGIMLAVILVMGQSGFASLNLDPAAIHAYQGSSPFSAGGVLNGYVDYAVFAPGQYDGTVSFNNLYVYAYQVFSNPSSMVSIDYFSVGLKSGISVPTVMYDSAADYAVPGGNIPTLSLLMPQQVLYLFQSDSISATEYSRTLLFTSNIGPGMAEGVVSAGFAGGAIMALPSPVPEPATLGLLIGGALMAIRRKRKV